MNPQAEPISRKPMRFAPQSASWIRCGGFLAAPALMVLLVSQLADCSERITPEMSAAERWELVERLAARDDWESIVILAETFEVERNIELRGRIARILAPKGARAVEPVVSVVSASSAGLPSLGGGEPGVFTHFPTELYVPIAMMGAAAVEPRRSLKNVSDPVYDGFRYFHDFRLDVRTSIYHDAWFS